MRDLKCFKILKYEVLITLIEKPWSFPTPCLELTPSLVNILDARFVHTLRAREKDVQTRVSRTTEIYTG